MVEISSYGCSCVCACVCSPPATYVHVKRNLNSQSNKSYCYIFSFFMTLANQYDGSYRTLVTKHIVSTAKEECIATHNVHCF